MPKKKRPFQRIENPVGDPSLLVIASEDTHAPKQYFSRFATTRLQFIVLETTDGRSSPLALVERLDDIRKTTEFDYEIDQFWLCLDQDHWAEPGHISSLVQAMKLCRSKGYGFALSNPCFDLWVLLHFHDRPLPGSMVADDVRALLVEHHGGYNKAKCCGHLPFTNKSVHEAIARARTLEVASIISERPNTQVYRIVEELLQQVYRIVEELLQRESIEIRQFIPLFP